MIRCVLIFNEQGKPRIVRFYDETVFNKQQVILQTVFTLVSSRNDASCCCFVNDLPAGVFDVPGQRVIYRHFASLYFVIIADACESELGILDLLQVFVHVLDSCLENICELDIVYHYDRVNYVLDEMIMAGMVLETSSEVILNTISDINKFSKAVA